MYAIYRFDASIKCTICKLCVHTETETYAPTACLDIRRNCPKDQSFKSILNTSRFHSLSPLFIVVPERRSGTHPLCCAADRRVTVLRALQMCVHVLFKFHLEVFCTLADQIVTFNFKVVQTVFETSNFFHHCLQKWNKQSSHNSIFSL